MPRSMTDLLLQRRRRAGLHAGAARDALGVQEALARARRHLGVEATALIVSANVPCISSQARTQREQTMHLVGSKSKYGLDVSFARRGGSRPRSRTDLAQADHARHVLQFAVAVGRAGEAVERVVGDVELHDVLDGVSRAFASASRDLHAVGRPGVVHEAGVPLRPSISTRHSRHDPNASRLSVAHSFGMSTPASAAARMTEVPSGTVTGSAVDLELDGGRAVLGRRAEVGFLEQTSWRIRHRADAARASANRLAGMEILGEMG